MSIMDDYNHYGWLYGWAIIENHWNNYHECYNHNVQDNGILHSVYSNLTGRF